MSRRLFRKEAMLIWFLNLPKKQRRDSHSSIGEDEVRRPPTVGGARLLAKLAVLIALVAGTFSHNLVP